MRQLGWPLRLFYFGGRAGRFEFWSIILCSAVVASAIARWDMGRRAPGGDFDGWSWLGIVGFFAAMAAGVFAVCRRVRDLGYHEIIGKYLVLLVFLAYSIVQKLTPSHLVANAVCAGVTAASLCLVGFPRGIEGQTKFGPDPRSPR